MCAVSLCLSLCLCLTLLLPTVLGAACEIEHCMTCDVGPCTECEYGYYGYTCTEKCHGCWHGGCEIDTGRCIQCLPGYFTDKCDTSCPVTCRASYDGKINCDRMSGHCLEGCENSHWGFRCQNNCSRNCVGFACEEGDGTCLGVCLDGSFGKQCDKSCPQNCRYERCSVIRGDCSEDCNPGFAGLKCNITCENCIDGECTYNDLDQSLNCTKGCTDGWTYADCKQKCSIRCLDRTCYRNGTCQTCQGGYFGNRCFSKCNRECQTCDRRGHCAPVPTVTMRILTLVTTTDSGSTKLNSVLYLVVTLLVLHVVQLSSLSM